MIMSSFLVGDAKKVAHLVGEGTEIPDVCDGYDELDVSGAFATHFLFGHFHTATVADDAFYSECACLAAMALVVLWWDRRVRSQNRPSRSGL